MKSLPNFLFLLFTLICLVSSSFSQYVVNDVMQFNSVMKKVKAGDVIIWENGLYKDIKINFSPVTKGTEKKPITLRAQSPGRVSFSGNTQVAIRGSYLHLEGFLFTGPCSLKNNEHVIEFTSGSEFCRVTNCAVNDFTVTEESQVTNYYINMLGKHNEVDHCNFKGKLNKGPVLVIEYEQGNGYIPGSDKAPSTFHRIHHNYFGYRTYSANGGEQIRVGTSTTSFTHGFNIVEYNFFENERIEAEVISNKSWNNIYRFNTLYNNDGGLVIRHGQQCFVYGNYINGNTGREQSAGLRVINPNNTVFNNYMERIEGGEKGLKSPIAIMAGLEGAELNEYYPADNAIIACNTVVFSAGPAIKIGVGNLNKGKLPIAPRHVWIEGNVVFNTIGENDNPVELSDLRTQFTAMNNYYTNGKTDIPGFQLLSPKKIQKKSGFIFVDRRISNNLKDTINKRLAIHQIKLSEKEITWFDPKWRIKKDEVGVSWSKEK